ncbi:MAG: lysophospholipase L1-like esterase [Paenibacillus sp.]|nr:lysophospholipase L1-like esterase [Paenibacillus sp.]
MKIYKYRNSLSRAKSKLQQGYLTIGYIGGSITQHGRSAHNWPEPVTRWFVQQYPNARISVENAAIGATGSDLAVFRAERDLIRYECDLVFIEFAVNDNGSPSERRMRSREGLIRKLLAEGRSELVLVYTYCQDMYKSMSRGELPPSILEFEKLAEHYGISSIWMGLYAWKEVQAGLMTWDEWLPDGLHPTHRGSFSYGQCVIRFLEKGLQGETRLESAQPLTVKPDLPVPFHSKHWQHASLHPIEDVQLEGHWTFIRSNAVMPWVDRMLCTSAIGAKLSFTFLGCGLALAFDFGKKSSEFRYRLNGGESVTTLRERPEWCQDGGWLQIYWIDDELEHGMHHFELEVVHGDRAECKGTHFHLAMIGIISQTGG